MIVTTTCNTSETFYCNEKSQGNLEIIRVIWQSWETKYMLINAKRLLPIYWNQLCSFIVKTFFTRTVLDTGDKYWCFDVK